MKFSIIGTGAIMPKHKDAIESIGGEIIDIIDITHGENAWKEMIKNTEANYIVILSPNYLHFEMALEAAKAGKIVICEKPLTINSQDAEKLFKYKNIFTFLQLRHHPDIKKLKSELDNNKNRQIKLYIGVHRDENYFKTWKGDPEKSGNILFNLGIHYFDLILYLFGEPEEIITENIEERRGKGMIKGKNYICDWEISANELRENQKRYFKIDGKNYDLIQKENLHRCVYREIINGKGIIPQEAVKSIKLVEEIIKSFKQNKTWPII